MKKLFFILSALLLFLLIATLWWGWALQAEVERLKARERSIEVNEKVIEFANAFITIVLRAEGEVEFESRLKLENMVRDIGDREIFDAWSAIPKSTSENDAQKRVLDLLEILVGKISTQESIEKTAVSEDSNP